MKYKMICIDMDGTLLNSKKVVSEENRIALKKAYEKGVHIIICTGRNPKNAIYFSEFLGVNCAVIANNGAWVIDEDKEVIISKDVLDEKSIKGFLVFIQGIVCIGHQDLENIYVILF